jgi:ferrous iron transport protein B
MDINEIRAALTGNPNSGKSTIFNQLTGARQHVGNYPGVTVEIKEGTCSKNGIRIKFADLPGTYSLNAYSPEEKTARDFIIRRRPDVIVDIVDASNIERNLYLAVELLELGAPLVIVLNMSDIALLRGYEFDLGKLSAFFNSPFVSAIGSRGEGMDELLEKITEETGNSHYGAGDFRIDYGSEIEKEVAVLEELIEKEVEAGNFSDFPEKRWVAVKLLESDPQVLEEFSSPAIEKQLPDSMKRLERILGDSPEVFIAEHRYGYITGACQEAAKSNLQSRLNWSDRIDAIVTNRVLGIPVFLGIMYLLFYLTFTLSEAPMGWIEQFFEWLGRSVGSFWAEGSQSVFKSLLVDGVIGGVGGVLVFLPVILFLFLAISILEDSGYMARAAFMMDRVMSKIGLHGKSFIPMLLGFGCTVPAIMATRTLENRRDRLTTMLVLPLISCGARMPIYALFIPAFFAPRWRTPVLWIIYITGIVLAIVMAKLLRMTLFRGESAPFVMELPPYHLPTPRSILLHMWERAWLFLKKAGTVIVAFSIILWFLSSYPKPDKDKLRNISQEEAGAVNLSNSFAGRIGHALAPLMRPVGFDWKTSTAMIGAFAAKEIFVAQLGIVHSIGEEADEDSEPLRDKLRSEYTRLQAVSILLFCLISAPCMVTIAATRRESGSWKWALFQLAGLTLLAWIVSFAVYQGGLMAGFGP